MKQLLQTLFFFLLVTQICFAQWYQQNSGTAKNLNAVTFTDANNGIAVGDSGTILRTTDGGTNWTPVATQITCGLTGVSFPDVNNGWIVGGGGYGSNTLCVIIRSSDGGSTWAVQLEDSLGEIRDIWFVDNMVGFAVGAVWDLLGYGHSVLLKTTDSGISWVWNLFDAWAATTFEYIDVNTWWIQSRSAGMGGSGEKFYKTEDGGTSWSLKLDTWTGIHGQGPPRTNDIHFRDSNNGVAVGEAVYRTTDGGDTWIDTLVLAQGTVNKVTFGDVVTGTAVGESIYRTTDGGVSWNAQTSGTANSLRGVCFIDASTGWAVGENGTILHTTNGGVVPVELISFTASANGKEVTLNWSTATELNNQGFEVQRKFGSNDFVTVGSVRGHGTTTSPNQYSYVDKLTDAGKYFYRLKQMDFGGKYEYSQTVEINWSPFTTYKLEQNYPNPFNPTTTIGFGIPEKGDVRLSVLNILGEEIKILLNEGKEAGYHSVDFNASDLPSGVYFYRIQSGNFINAKKMILLR